MYTHVYDGVKEKAAERKHEEPSDADAADMVDMLQTVLPGLSADEARGRLAQVSFTSVAGLFLPL
jgi:hypothetical protein